MIYALNGSQLSEAFGYSGNELVKAYDHPGNIIYQKDTWPDEITVSKIRDEASGTNYYLTRIPQTRPNGDKQYPFLYAPNGTGQATQSTLDMNRQHGFYLAINAGIGGTYTVEQGVLPIGCLIENGVLLQQGTSEFQILTIDNAGYLDYAEPNTNGNNLIAAGVVISLSVCVRICDMLEDVL